MPIIDSSELLHTYNKATGLIEVYNIHTGALVAVQKTAVDLLAQGKSENLLEMVTEDGHTVWVEAGVPLDRIPKAHTQRSWIYSKTMQDLICERIVNGESLKTICETKGFPPYSVICQWKRTSSDFARALDMARKDRAEHHYTEVLKIAKNTNSWNSKGDKVKIDAAKWAAQVDDPDRFGNKTKLVGDADAPISFRLETGIRRPGDPGFNVDETARLKEQEQKLVEAKAPLEIMERVAETVSHFETGAGSDE